MTDTPVIHGQCQPQFESVKEAFKENFTQRGDVGAAVCVYLDGRPIVDIWGGYADADRRRPWERDTIASVASTTKGMVAICVHLLIERGLLNVDLPVAYYWPEFARKGKESIPVRWLLSHRAGLPGVRWDMPPETLYDWDRYVDALAESEPWWEPGTRHGYHALTFGYLVGEVVRRITGKTVGRFFQSEVAGPLEADFFIGVPEALDHRAAEILPEPPPAPGDRSLWDLVKDDPTSITGRAFLNPPRQPEVMNNRTWRAAEIPSSNGHTSACALARIYGLLAQGGILEDKRLLQPETIEAAIVEQSNGPDAVMVLPSRFGLGFGLTRPERPLGPNPRAFGHSGQGGSTGFADLDARIGFGYVMNQYISGTVKNPDLRWPKLVEAVYASL
ncbi:MAG: beta-lactamase family protein [Proteobacteria bacterium]|nr:beta-lactamase family protein [Pseudomonadota bacterium]